MLTELRLNAERAEVDRRQSRSSLDDDRRAAQREL
eukprot:gene25480-43974_t